MGLFAESVASHVVILKLGGQSLLFVPHIFADDRALIAVILIKKTMIKKVPYQSIRIHFDRVVSDFLSVSLERSFTQLSRKNLKLFLKESLGSLACRQLLKGGWAVLLRRHELFFYFIINEKYAIKRSDSASQHLFKLPGRLVCCRHDRPGDRSRSPS
jgi:hypothetical protein